MALDVRPHIVHGVQERFPTQGRPATRGLSNVVVLHGDGVARTDHLEHPVMVPVAAGRVVRCAVDEVAGQRDARAGREAEDVVLATGACCLT